jgi:peptidoglycan/xylan/chitin deacetylase (PgdA/CDA1 family)
MRRDLVGYGRRPPEGPWPNGCRIAVSIVVNYEEGSERSLASGDDQQETSTEWGDYPFPAGQRNLAMESMYEYGARVGIWRVFRILDEYAVPATMFACARALELNDQVAGYLRSAAHEICSHGYRWEEVFRLSRDEERARIVLALTSIERSTGRVPVGWYCRYGPSPHTRELLVENGAFLYDSDSYGDDVPYFVPVNGRDHLVVPYSPDANDFRFWQANGPVTAADFGTYLVDTFDTLYAEAAGGLRMMSVGLHPRIIGRPGRIGSLRQFLDHCSRRDGVWFATREQIARAWLARPEHLWIN